MTTQPESLSAAVKQLRDTGVAMAAQNAAVAIPTSAVHPAGSDAVSAVAAAQFALHGEMYQAVSAQAKAIHEVFTSILAQAANTAVDS
ncbi:PE family protein [Mycobacterium kyorinense]|uniref:PE family protein n=1 Tax=Mycobacterium kyorinense TaxID=487514 RepID=A0A1A2YY11_9MYCO|nr:PE family protein [Mycobacterium kyorinense]OBI42283.1 PE family protein [Mycobacterium kyorinense]